MSTFSSTSFERKIISVVNSNETNFQKSSKLFSSSTRWFSPFPVHNTLFGNLAQKLFFQESSNPPISTFSWKHEHESDDEWNIIMNTFWQIIMMMLCGWMVGVVARLMKMSVIIIEVRGLEQKLSTSGEICLTIIYHVETVSLSLQPPTFFSCFFNVDAIWILMPTFIIWHTLQSFFPAIPPWNLMNKNVI